MKMHETMKKCQPQVVRGFGGICLLNVRDAMVIAQPSLQKIWVGMKDVTEQVCVLSELENNNDVYLFFFSTLSTREMRAHR